MDEADDIYTPGDYFAWGVAYVADRTAADESGFLIVSDTSLDESGNLIVGPDTHPAFDPYDPYTGKGSAPAPSYNAASQTYNAGESYVVMAEVNSLATPPSQTMWGAYWIEAAGLLEEEK